MTLTFEEWMQCTEDQRRKMCDPAYLAAVAAKHLEAGNFVNYPQVDIWDDYKGMKYGIWDFSLGDFVGSSFKHEGTGKPVLCWTPYYKVAADIASKIKACGWKYKDTEVIQLTTELIKTKGYMVCANAGFQPFSIERKDETVEIVPKSQINEDAIEAVFNG